jgi:hypothetical protein
MKNAWILGFTLAALLACGGGGGGGSSPSSSESTTTGGTTSFEGTWVGTVQSKTSNTTWNATGLVLASGNLAFALSNGEQMVGTLSGSNSSFTGSGTIFASETGQLPNGNMTETAQYSGSGTPGDSFTGTYTAADDNGTFSFTWDANADYDTPVVLANLAGTYQCTASSNGQSAKATLNADGTFSGSDSTGSFTGSLTAVDASKNGFQVSVTYSPSGQSSQTLSGLGFFDFNSPVSLNLEAVGTQGVYAGVFTQSSSSSRPSITRFYADPFFIESGSTSTLTGVFSNGTGVITQTSPAGSFSQTITSGAGVHVSPTVTTTYTLTVTGATGTTPATQTATVTVGTSQAQPKITSFTANPSTIQSGSTSTLTGVFSNGTGVITQTSPAGSYSQDVTSGNRVQVSPTVTTTYTLTVTGATGTTPATQTAKVTVTGTSPTQPTITSFTANPAIASGVSSASAALTANFTGGTAVITPGAIPATNGVPVEVTLTATTTYTLTVTNSVGAFVTSSATVWYAPTLLLQHLYIVYLDSEQHINIVESSNGLTWSSPINSSIYSPCYATIAGSGFYLITYIDSDNNLMVDWSEGSLLGVPYGPTKIGWTSNSAPNITGSPNGYYISYLNNGQMIVLYSGIDSTTFTWSQFYDVPGKTNLSPNIIYFNNTIYVAYRDSASGELKVASLISTGINTSEWSTVTFSGIFTETTPCFAIFNNQLYICWVDNNWNLFVSPYSPTTLFENPVSLQTNNPPSMISFNGNLVLSYLDLNNNICITISSDGQTWSPSVGVGVTSPGPPSAAAGPGL